MAWIDPNDQIPVAEEIVLCRIRSCYSGNVQVQRMVLVTEEDLGWLTAADRSELNFEWDVIAWKPILPV